MCPMSPSTLHIAGSHLVVEAKRLIPGDSNPASVCRPWLLVQHKGSCSPKCCRLTRVLIRRQHCRALLGWDVSGWQLHGSCDLQQEV